MGAVDIVSNVLLEGEASLVCHSMVLFEIEVVRVDNFGVIALRHIEIFFYVAS